MTPRDALRLVVIADDFGETPDNTDAIAEAHDRGIVTEASYMPTAPAAAQAMDLARSRPALGVGVHLALTFVPSALTGEPLPPGPAAFAAAAAARRPFSAGWIRRELDAQLDRAIADLAPLERRPTHLTGHQHLHLLPAIFPHVLRLAARHRIPYVRVVRPSHLTARPWPRTRFSALRRLSMAPFAAAALRHAPPPGVRLNDHLVGLDHSGALTAPALRRLAAALPPRGVVELLTHPGHADDDDPTRYHKQSELDALCDPEVRRLLDARGVRLCRADEL